MAQSNFSELLERLLERSKEGNRCWAKVHRIRDNDPYRENYVRSGQDADQARANIRNLLLKGKYIAESKRKELAAIEEIKKRIKNYHWELDFNPIDRTQKYLAKEEREILELLETLKKQVESGEQFNIERSGQKELDREQEEANQAEINKFEVLDNEIMNEVLSIGINVDNNACEVKDYKKIKNLQRRLKSWPNIKRVEYIEGRKKDLEKTLQELENKVPARIKLKANRSTDRRGRTINNCFHKNIYWKLDEIAYCLDCGEDENETFLSKLSLFCQKIVDNWVEKHQLKGSREVLKITSKFYQIFTTQEQIKNTYQQVVNELNAYAKSQGINDLIDDNKERERERERAKNNA